MTELNDFAAVKTKNATVFSGSNLNVLPFMADNSIDAIVTDPPYELGFMGKSWDSSGIAYNVELWQQCLRVLKPGGHLLAFGGSRTWHRIAVAIEDAGFEVRDSIAWLYGSGFPKSLNVSKAVDDLRAKQDETKPDNLGLLPDEEKFCEWMKNYSGFTEAQCKNLLGSARFITGVVEIVNTATKENPRMGRRAMVPTTAAWEKIRPLLATVPPEWVEALVKEPPKPGIEHPSEWNSGKGEGTTGTNEWAGWGTALKPAFEPVVVARKPFIGTVAANVLEYGVGALNIDGSRIAGESWGSRPPSPSNGITLHGLSPMEKESNHLGRWPANIILDEYTAEILDEQSGISTSRPAAPSVRKTTITGDERTGAALGMYGEGAPIFGHNHNDTGGASRFFYVAKASKRDRNEGLDDLDKQRRASLERSDTDKENLDPVSERFRTQPAANFHPTVKPTDLMRYLIRLVTPEGGLVLDPFTGSGSTGKAALLDGYRFYGIELTNEYLPIIQGRLTWAEEEAKRVAQAAAEEESIRLF